MIRETTGDILTADAEALVNPVNTAGVMDKGLAAQVKAKYPEMFREYAALCQQGVLQIGKISYHSVNTDLLPWYVINFPTKQDRRQPSRLEWIDVGLVALRHTITELGILSIAIPPLGCGLGGLRWADVRPLIEQRLGDLGEVDVVLYAPKET